MLDIQSDFYASCEIIPCLYFKGLLFLKEKSFIGIGDFTVS